MKTSQRDGSGQTSFAACKDKAEAAMVHYFAWTSQIYNGYCKVLFVIQKTILVTFEEDIQRRYFKVLRPGLVMGAVVVQMYWTIISYSL